MRTIHLVTTRGQADALAAGMRRATGDYIRTPDGDLQTEPCDCPRMPDLLKTHDCVCGYRASRQDNFVRKFSSKIGNGAWQRILKDGIRDAGCGSKGFRRKCVEHIIPFNGVHRYFAVMMRNGGMTIAECPGTHHPRGPGVAK